MSNNNRVQDIDCVWFPPDYTDNQVFRSLTVEDNYPVNIIVRRG